MAAFRERCLVAAHDDWRGESKGSLERGRSEVGLDRTAHKFPRPTCRRDPDAPALPVVEGHS
jgi:hypothetical protein